MAGKNRNPNAVDNLTRKSMGRPVGAVNKMTRILKDAIMLAACEVGDVSMYVDTTKVTTPEQRGELVGFLKWLAVNEPVCFAGMLGKLLPIQMAGSLEVNEKKTYATKEEVMEEMKRRGLPVAPIFAKGLPVPTHNESETEQ